MNEREAAIASFHHHGTGVEIKGFDKLYDVVITHDDIVPDRRVVVLRLASDRADSKCRGLIAQSIADNSPRLDSTVAMTCHRSSPSSAAALILPPIVITLMAPFRSFFTAPVWEHVLVLVTGIVLAPGKRTVSAALRVMGLGETRDFALYHFVLSRARWNSRGIARTLLTMILDRFVPTGPVVIGIDDTIERRWGRKIAARGIYRDPVRSSHGHFVKTSGLRWLSLMAMVPVPWTQRRWAMPFLTILAPSERYHTAHRRRHKKLTDFARQAILQVRRWLPKRKIVVVADSSFAALDLIAAIRRHVCLVTRLRLDANLFTPAPKRRPGQRGRTAKKGRPLPKLSKMLEKKTTRWTRLSMPYWYGDERCILEIATGTAIWYHSGLSPASVRWVLVRDPTGCAIRKPSCALISMRRQSRFSDGSSIVGPSKRRFRKAARILASRRNGNGPISPSRGRRRRCLDCSRSLRFGRPIPTSLGNLRPRSTAWYQKREPSFSDVIAAVRRLLWSAPNLSMSRHDPDGVEIPAALWERLTEALCYAA